MSNDTIKIREEKIEEVVDPDFIIPSEEKISELYKKRFFPRDTSRNSFTFSRTLNSSPTVTTVASTASETDLASIVILANENRLYTTFKIYAAGVYSTLAGGNATVAIRVGLGAAPTTEWNIMTTTAADVTNVAWHLNWTGIITVIGTSGTLEAQLQGKTNNVNKDDPNTATVTFNTTIRNTIGITADWTASDASNTISIRQFICEIIY